MAFNRRPASVQPPAPSSAVTEMEDKLKSVSFWQLKDQMIAAGIADAKNIDWIQDLIPLAVKHNFTYVFPQRRGLAPPTVPLHVPVPRHGSPSIEGLGVIPAAEQHQSDAPPVPVPLSAKQRVIIQQNVPVLNDDCIVAAPTCVADSLAKLYEAEWTQAFPPSFIRGYEFPDTHTSQEIQVVIKEMGHNSSCCFHKTDEYSKKVPTPRPDDWSDGWDVTIRFECPHRQEAGIYIVRKGRVTENESDEPWRNKPRDSLHVTGTKCKASFSINGMLQLDMKYKWRVSPKKRANFSLLHSGHPPPYAKYLQNMILSVTEKLSIQDLVASGADSTVISNFLSQNGQKGAISKQTVQFIANEIEVVEQTIGTLRLRETGESEAQALINNLQALPNCKVVFLVKEIGTRANVLTSVINCEANQFVVDSTDMDECSSQESQEITEQLSEQPELLIRVF
jgi:hypothetical protein